MKKILICVIVYFLVNVIPVFAYSPSEFTNDGKIIQAMNLLESIGETGVFENLKKNAVKVSFGDLSLLGLSSKVYAVNTYDRFGRRIIMINDIYRDAPVEQIACLVAHESCHVLRIANLDEETIATQKEASCWTKLKSKSTTYPDTKLTKRLDKLAGLYIASDGNNNLIHDKIANSSFYMAQFGS